MARLKPKIFVGSSSEARTIAEHFSDVLSDVAVMIPWWLSKEFYATQSILTGLVQACNSYDFGLFILTPDDKLQSHGKKGMSARDNVLFEFGLFLGDLGANRTFAVIQDSELPRKRVKVPSDLGGIVIPRFASGDRDTVLASIRGAANALRPQIIRESRRRDRLKLVDSWGYDAKARTFSMTLSKDALERNRDELTYKSLAVVALKENKTVAVESDTSIAIGESRRLSIIPGDLVLRASGTHVFTSLRTGDTLFCYLLLIPDGLSIANKRTISEMLADGCELLERKGVANSKHSP